MQLLGQVLRSIPVGEHQGFSLCCTDPRNELNIKPAILFVDNVVEYFELLQRTRRMRRSRIDFLEYSDLTGTLK